MRQFERSTEEDLPDYVVDKVLRTKQRSLLRQDANDWAVRGIRRGAWIRYPVAQPRLHLTMADFSKAVKMSTFGDFLAKHD